MCETLDDMLLLKGAHTERQRQRQPCDWISLECIVTLENGGRGVLIFKRQGSVTMYANEIQSDA